MAYIRGMLINVNVNFLFHHAGALWKTDCNYDASAMNILAALYVCFHNALKH